ncbi:MAG: hypothetical protein AB7U75_19015 [Hyphomicrobiaceae bacterium]
MRTRPVYRKVTRQVVVRPAQQVRHVSPAVYTNLRSRIRVRDGSTRRICSPEIKAIVHRKVLLEPAERNVIHHPAVIGTRYQRVLAREPGNAWRSTHHGRGLFGR